MSSAYHIVIPARMAAARLPGKPLLDVGGKTLIERVHERASAAGASSVVVATDDAGIADVMRTAGAAVVMTSSEHASGSDRIAECVELLGWDDETLVVNLQGDEALMPPACLDQVAELLSDTSDADVASLYWPVTDAAEVEDRNVVKVVVDASGAALYFSRAVIPHARAHSGTAKALEAGLSWKRHIGLYAYRAGALRAFTATRPTPLEVIEKLEQLRFLESGRRIIMAQATEPIPAGVDTPADLQRVRDLLQRTGGN